MSSKNPKNSQLIKRMPNTLNKYISKLKKLPRSLSLPSHRLCKFPRTPSFVNRRVDCHVINPDSAATLSDVDRFLIENFRSLYVNSARDDEGSTSSTESDDLAVTVFTRNPYDEFRRSMKGVMVERHVDGLGASDLDWDSMEEILFSFLDANDHGVHKFILKAFSDLTVGFQVTKDPNKLRVAIN